MKRVHIVGPPRSGTTVMLELMGVSFRFDLWANQERDPFVIPPRPANAVLTKRPGDGVLAKPLLAIDPDQYFIALIRDPRDVIVSRHGRRPSVYWANLRQFNREYGIQVPLVDHPRFVRVRYEALARDPDGVQAQILEAMPFLERVAPFSDYPERSSPSRQSLEAMRSARPIDAESIGRWREHLPRVAGQCQQHGAPIEALIELGYEPDDAWLRLLEGVEPDLSPSHWPEVLPSGISAQRLAKRRQGLIEYAAKRGLSLDGARAFLDG